MYTPTGIGDAQVQHTIVYRQFDIDAAAFGREFEGVRQQVVQNLAAFFPVYIPNERWWHGGFEGKRICLRSASDSN